MPDDKAIEVKQLPDRFTRDEFVSYLMHTLIPDLRESGRDETADDFERAVQFIRGAHSVPVTYDA